MIRKYTFLGEFVTLNNYIDLERRNRFLAAKVKKQETETVALEIKDQDDSKIDYKIDVHFVVYWKNARKDPDAAMFGIKYTLDSLQKAGVIKNDGQKEIGDIRLTTRVDKENPRVEVFIKKSIDK